MRKINDTQAVLLSAASQRDSGSLLPLPPSLASFLAKTRATKAIATLIADGFAEERETSDRDATAYVDVDLPFGVFITPAGLSAIGVAGAGSVATSPVSVAATVATPRGKSAEVLTLLQRADGATLAELVAATGWLPHTTRAALTGLRKKGHAVERGKRGEETCYRVAA